MKNMKMGYMANFFIVHFGVTIDENIFWQYKRYQVGQNQDAIHVWTNILYC
jgi:hypothetical protein